MFKLFGLIISNSGYSSRKLEEFYRTSFRQICNLADRLDAEGVKGLRINQTGERAALSLHA
jgi:hypothetical protein